MRFFVGRTESVGRVKVMFHQAYGTRSTGQGRIEPDGSLYLVQQVFDDGKPPHERRWRVRQVGPGRYTGTMTEASGPVTIDRLGDRFRFSFRMNGRTQRPADAHPAARRPLRDQQRQDPPVRNGRRDDRRDRPQAQRRPRSR